MTATVQGKKLDLTASSVAELQEQVASAQGLRADRQAVFFKGKKLSPSDSLASAGVQDGDQLTVTASRGRSAVAGSRVAGRGAGDVSMELDDIDRGLDEMGSMPPAQAGGPASPMGGGGGGMMDAMFGGAQQKEVLEALSDPKKLEQSRQMLLNHPMYKQMAASVPGLAEAVNDPQKWKETMDQARDMMGQVRCCCCCLIVFAAAAATADGRRLHRAGALRIAQVQAGGPQAEEMKKAMAQGMQYFGQGGLGGAGAMGGLGGLDALLGGGVKKDGPAAKLGVDAEVLSRAFGHTVATQAATMGLSLGEAVRGMVEGARGGEMPLTASAYDEQMTRLLAKAGLRAGEGGVAHKAMAVAGKKVRAVSETRVLARGAPRAGAGGCWGRCFASTRALPLAHNPLPAALCARALTTEVSLALWQPMREEPEPLRRLRC